MQRDVPADVVTMNSEVAYEDCASASCVYPKDADASRGRVSVLAPIGSALLGVRVGQSIEWPVPAGANRIRVIERSATPVSAAYSAVLQDRSIDMSVGATLVRRRGMKGDTTMVTQLLNDDGTASMATMIMSSHHAFRRDVTCFAHALAGAHDNLEALSEEWTNFRGALHGHHTVEDTAVFPDLRARVPSLANTLDELDGHHKTIDPLLERGDVLFADLANSLVDARELIAKLHGLLAEHLDAEERSIIPHMRDAKEFPPLPSEDAVAMYADGFAWSTAGLAPSVYAQICAMLPPALVAKLPSARAAFDERCKRVWGHVHVDASVTSAPAPS